MRVKKLIPGATFVKKTFSIYTTKATYLRRKFCKKQLFLYTPLKQLILSASFVKNSVAKRIFAELSPETQSACAEI